MGHIKGNIKVINRTVFTKICSIADTPSAEILLSNLKEQLGEQEAQKLIDVAFKQSGNRQDIDVIVNDEERSYTVENRGGTLSYFQPDSGRWYAAPLDKLKIYKVNFDWLINASMSALSIESTTPVCIHEEKIWFIGSAWLKKRKTPIIFIRNISKQEVLENLDSYLKEKHKSQPALIITTANNIPTYFRPYGQSRIAMISEVVDSESDKLAFNMSYLSDKMDGNIEQEGFSNGYRTLHHNGQTYNFSKTKARALEYMHKIGRPAHQEEILAEARSEQKRLAHLFRNDPAWKEIFKTDGKGNYWLVF